MAFAVTGLEVTCPKRSRFPAHSQSSQQSSRAVVLRCERNRRRPAADSRSPMTSRHLRLRYAASAVALIVVGLIVHRVDLGLHPIARDMLGDALWAAMIYCWLGALLTHASGRTRMLLALAICFAVEASQLYRAPWLDALRATVPGHLVLGSGYESRDLLSYFLGVAAAAGASRFLRSHRSGEDVCARSK